MKKSELKKIIKEELNKVILNEASKSEIAKWQVLSENTYRALNEMKKFIGKSKTIVHGAREFNLAVSDMEDAILEFDKILRYGKEK